ncbi:MAG: hypothetical protein ACFFCE_17335 [Promethearchaeota archaeon]
MVQVLEKRNTGIINVKVTFDLEEIRKALEKRLYVPDIHIKPKLIDELFLFLKDKLSDPQYKFKPIIGYQNGEISGFVICCIHPHYTSYSRKCGTFGWLTADSFKVCKKMIELCEEFIKINKIRKIRGPINFPKSLGGIGIQTMGFHEQMLYGVAFTDPRLKISDYLQTLGYYKESEYTCVHVAQKTWKKGKKVDKDIIFRYFILEELYNYIDDIESLAANSLYQIMPDSSGINRIHEFFEAFNRYPKCFNKNQKEFSLRRNSEIPQFSDALQTCDVEKIEPLAPMAFDKKTGALVGILLGLPDLYELLGGNPVSRCNVDTAMVKKGYFGKGIFSALNNIGQLTANLYGIDYFEGTTIWSNNSLAIDTIFPHCIPVRKHYVFQKRL